MCRRALAVALILALFLLISLPSADVMAAHIDEKQPVNVYLGGIGDNRTLSPSVQNIQGSSISSDMLAARGGLFLTQTAYIGTWHSKPSPTKFAVSGQVDFRFWARGDVKGTYLELNLSVGNEWAAHTTEPMDTGNVPRMFNGSFKLPGTLIANPGESLSLSISWGGDQDMMESWTNNTIELLYGANTDSGLIIQTNSVSITDATSEPHPILENTIIFRITATSIFGPEDLEEVDISTSVTEGSLGDMEETVEGDYKIFTTTWNYTKVDFPDEVTLQVSLKVRDSSGNWWEKESSVIIIYPKEEVDLKITYDQVNLFPHMPTVGEETTVEVMFTGLGKNWASATVLILFYEGDYLIETREAVANMGENGPYDFKWTPKTPGEHRIRIVLDESDISSPGLNATNNKVEQIVTVLPEEEEAVIGTEEGPPPYLLILIVIVIMAISAIGVGYAFSSQRKSRSEEPAEENKILDVPGQPPIPVPQHGPEGTPQGFFIHSTGSPSTWIDTTSGKL